MLDIAIMACQDAPMQDEVNKAFGQAIRAKRGSLPRWEIASRCGLSPETIGRYERGEGGPSLADAFKIAAALGCQVSELLPDEVAA
jgi:DNA-binding XRE family transcriptional regulator